MKKFSIRPTLTMKGRTSKGLRGWSGKPLHPPLTDIPIAAYIIAAIFDIVSFAGGKEHDWARTMWHAGTYLFVGGVAVSVFAALTGLWDAWKSSDAGTQARRTINTHATIMITVTILAIIDLVWRLNDYNTALVTPVAIMILSIVVAGLVALGATFGGAMVFEYGFNVETAGDHPAWHTSETDVFPGHHEEDKS
ncbi:MAG: DUF2231 domain-containing protein [Ilumatobacteraceae bacterium]